MNLRSRCLLALLLCGTAACGSESTPVTPEVAATPAESQARAAIRRFAEVTHAQEVIARTSALHASGTFSMKAMGLDGPVQIWSAKPDRRRVSIGMGAFGTMETGADGTTAWMSHPLIGARVLEGTELLQAMLEAPYDAPLRPAALYESVTARGQEPFEGKPCLAVVLVAKPLAGMDPATTLEARTSVDYYEVESGLLLGTESYQEGELGSGPVTTVFEDYRDFGGQLMAARTLVRQTGVEAQLELEKVEYDHVAPTSFDVPPEIQVLLDERSKKPGPAAEEAPQKAQ